jgi:hypothetical protein
MSETVGEAFVKIRPDFSGFAGEVKRGVTGTGTKEGEQVGRQMGQGIEKGVASQGSNVQRRIGGIFSGAGSLIEQTFGIPTLGVFDRVGGKIGEIEGKSKGLGATLASIGKGVALGGLAAFAGIATFSIKRALEGEQALVRLQNAIHNAGPEFAGLEKRAESLAGQFAKWGFTNDELEATLTKLIPVTKNEADAVAKATLAANFAKQAHISLESATNLVAQAETGRLRGIAKYIGGLKDANGATLSAEVALSKLAAVTSGAADRSASKFSGRLQALHAQVQNLAEKIGNALIPIIEKMVSAISVAVDWLEKHKAIAIALAIVVGTVLVAALVAMAAAAVTAAATTVIAMAPVLIPILAIGLAIADVILLWQRFGGDFEQAVNDTIIPAINTFIDGINTIIDGLNAIPLLGFDIAHVGYVGDLGGGGGGFNPSGGVGSKPYGPPLPGGAQYSKPIGPGLNGYASGGVVPGMVGAAQLAIVHGGEEVLTPAQRKNHGGDELHVHFHGVNPDSNTAAIRAARRLRIAQRLVAL